MRLISFSASASNGHGATGAMWTIIFFADSLRRSDGDSGGPSSTISAKRFRFLRRIRPYRRCLRQDNPGAALLPKALSIIFQRSARKVIRQTIFHPPIVPNRTKVALCMTARLHVGEAVSVVHFDDMLKGIVPFQGKISDSSNAQASKSPAILPFRHRFSPDVRVIADIASTNPMPLPIWLLRPSQNSSAM